MPDSSPKVTSPVQLNFGVDQFGLYALTITAQCTKEHDLRVVIDDQQFREIPPAKNIQVYTVPPAWNGTELRGLAKTVTFILTLTQGQHTLKLLPRTQATIEKWSYKLLENSQQLKFEINEQAMDGNRRPWHTFAFIDTPLKAITAEVTTQWHWLDGDDVKLIIDGTVEKNPQTTRQGDWAWSASVFQKISGPKTETKTFVKNLPKDIHYVEFWADRTPTLQQVKFDLGDFKPKRIPTKSDPEWTGSFDDDTDVMILARLIFGEARNQSKAAKIGVAWTIKNRLHANRKYFGFSYHEIILKNDGIKYQFSSLNPNEGKNFPLLINPLKTSKKVDQQNWLEAYDVASDVLNQVTTDPTGNATFFHSEDLSREIFVTQSVPGAIFIKQIGDFLFYRDPHAI